MYETIICSCWKHTKAFKHTAICWSSPCCASVVCQQQQSTHPYHCQSFIHLRHHISNKDTPLYVSCITTCHNPLERQKSRYKCPMLHHHVLLFFRSYKFSGMPLDPEYTENSIGCNILLKSELLWDGETTVCIME